MHETNRKRTSQRWLFFILLLSAVLRFYNLAGQSFWSDEGNSLVMAHRSMAAIWQYAAKDIHPPLYYWLLHIWQWLFGDSEFALRSLSVVLGIFLVWAIYFLAKKLWGRTTGLFAAYLAAINPFLIYYAQEVRMYTLLALASTLAALALLQLILLEGGRRFSRGELQVPDQRRQLKWWLGSLVRTAEARVGLLYALLLAIGLYTHYTFPLIALIFSLVYFIWLWETRHMLSIGRRLARWIGWNALALLFYLPWLPNAWHQITTWPNHGKVLSLNAVFTQSLALLSLGPEPSPTLLQKSLLFWAILLFLGLWPWRRRRHHGEPARPAYWLSWGMPLLWLIIPIFAMIALHLFRPSYQKFLLAIVPPYLVFISRGIIAPWQQIEARAKPNPLFQAVTLFWIGAALLVITGLSGLTLYRYNTDPSVMRDDYRGIARFITAIGRPGDAIILDAPGQNEVFNYYYRGKIPVYPLPRQRPPDKVATEAALQEILAGHQRIFALYWAMDESDPARIVESWLNSHAYKATDRWRHNVRFVVYAVPQSLDNAKWQTLNAHFGPDIVLNAYALMTPEVTSGNVIQLILQWKAVAKIDKRFKVSVQVLDKREQIVAQSDSEPVGNLRPTTTWKPGEIIQDRYGILVPFGSPPGRYRMIISLYDRKTGRRLPVQIGPERGDHITLPQLITVSRPKVAWPVSILPISHHDRIDFDEIYLIGHNRYRRGFSHNPEMPLVPGVPLHLTFFWQAKVQPSADWRVHLYLGSVQKAKAELVADLAGPTYPTTAWLAGDIVRGEHDLYLPGNIPPGRYPLYIRLEANGRAATPISLLDRITIQSP